MADGFVGQAFVQISPSFAGFQTAIRKEITGQLRGVGEAAGGQLGDAIARSVGRATGDGKKLIPKTGIEDEGAKAGVSVGKKIGDGLVTAAGKTATGITKTTSAAAAAMGASGFAPLQKLGGLVGAFGEKAAAAFQTAGLKAGYAFEAIGKVAGPVFSGIGKAVGAVGKVVGPVLSGAAKVAGAAFTTMGKVALAPVQAVGDALVSMGRTAVNVAGIATAAFLGFAAANVQTNVKARQFENALSLVGAQMGVTNEKLTQAVQKTTALGASNENARQLVMQFTKSGMDAGRAWELYARAEDIAVTSGRSGNEVIQELIYGLQTGNSNLQVFRSLNLSAADALDKYAGEIGKSKDQLSDAERQQALFNAVMDKTGNIAGVAGKMMREGPFNWAAMQAPIQNLKEAMGGLLEPAFTVVGRAAYGLTQAFTGAISEGGKFYPIVQVLRDIFKELATPLANIITKIKDFIGGVSGESVKGFADALKGIAPILPGIAAAMVTFAGGNVLKNIPIIGNQLGGMLERLGPLKAGLIGLALGMPGVRDAFGEVFKAVAPLLQTLGQTLAPILRDISQVLSSVLGEALRQLLPAFQALMPQLSQVVNLLGGALMQVIQALAPVLPVLGNAIGSIVTAIAPLLPSIARLVADLVELAVRAIGPLLPMIIRLAEIFFGILTDALGVVMPMLERIVPVVASIAEKIGDFLTRALLAAMPLLQRLGELFVKVLDALMPLLPPILRLVDVLIGELLKALEPMLPIINDLAVQLGEFVADALIAIAPLIEKVAEVAVALFKALAPLLPKIMRIAEVIIGSLLKALQPLIPAIVKVADKLGTLLIKALEKGGPLLEKLADILVQLVESLAPLLPSIGELAALLLEVAMEALEPLMPLIMELAEVFVDLLADIMPPLVEIIKALVPPLVEILKAVAPLIPIIVKLVVVALVPLVQAFSWVVNAIAQVVKWLLGGSPGLMPAIQAVGDAFKWVWETLIKPAWDALVAAVQWAWDNVFSRIFDLFKLAWDALGAAFSFVWNSIIKPAWDALKAAFSLYWNYYLNPIFEAFKLAWSVLAAAFKWVWEVVIKRAWDALSAAFSFVWNVILKPIFDRFKEVFSAVGDTVKWVWENVIKRAWDALSSAWSSIWNTVLKPAFEKMDAAFRTVGDAISWVWENVIKKVWEKMETAIALLKLGFEKQVDGIKKVWETMQKAVGTPVYFVAEKIINVLIKGINWLLEKVKIPTIPLIPTEDIPRFKRGGKVPGAGFGDVIPAMLEPGEWVLTRRQARAIGYGRLRALPRYQGGGPVDMIGDMENELSPKKKKWYERIPGAGIVKNIVSFVGDKLRWVAAKAFEAATKPLRKLIDAMPGEGGFVDMIKKMGHFLIDKAIELIKNNSESEDVEFGGGMNIDEIVKTIRQQFPQLVVTSAYRPQSIGSYHSKNLARDLGGPVDVMYRAGAWVQDNLTNALLEGIHNPTLSVKNFKVVPPSLWGPSTWAGHRDHLHLAADGAAAGTGAIGGTVGEWINQAMRLTGVNPAVWAQALAARVQTESGGNPRAINNWDSNAQKGTPSKGLMQTIDPTFRAFMMPGMGDIWNPVHNLVAAIRYVMSRYGASPGSLGRWHAFSKAGYDTGGWLPTGASIVVNSSGKPEPVLTARQWDDLTAAAREGQNMAAVVELLRRIAHAAEAGTSITIDGREIARVVDREIGWVA